MKRDRFPWWESRGFHGLDNFLKKNHFCLEKIKGTIVSLMKVGGVTAQQWVAAFLPILHQGFAVVAAKPGVAMRCRILGGAVPRSKP